MEVRLEACGDQIIPQDIYVSLRIGNVQKQSKYAPSRTFHFPELKDGKAGAEFGRVEVFKRLGTCTVPLSNLGLLPQEVKVPVPESPLDVLHFRLDMPSDVSGTQDRARERALKKKQRLEEAQRYVADHNLEELLATSLHNVMKEKPENPASFLSGHLLGGKDARPRPLLTPLAQAPTPSPPLSVSGPSPFQLPPSSPPPLSKPDIGTEGPGPARQNLEKDEQGEKEEAAPAAELEGEKILCRGNDRGSADAPNGGNDAHNRTEGQAAQLEAYRPLERSMNGDWRTMSVEGWTSLYSRFPARSSDPDKGNLVPEAWGSVHGRFVQHNDGPVVSGDAEVTRTEVYSPEETPADPASACVPPISEAQAEAPAGEAVLPEAAAAAAAAPPETPEEAPPAAAPQPDLSQSPSSSSSPSQPSRPSRGAAVAVAGGSASVLEPTSGHFDAGSRPPPVLPARVDAAYIQKLKEQIQQKEAKLKSLASQLLDLSQSSAPAAL